MKKSKPYIFIGKTLFFPENGILAIGDLHIGYEYKLQQSGVLIPERQIEELKEELKLVFDKIKNKGFKLKKIVFIGDLKHAFAYEIKEKNYFKDFFKFLEQYADEKNIILIKGNHDTIDYSFGDKLKNYYVNKEVAFSHGHKNFPEIFDKKIKTIVIGHLHPSILLSDKQEVKKEKYKCFLIGKFKGKEIIILPSFLSTIEGTKVNKIAEDYEDYFSIIPKKNLLNFKIYVVGEKENFDFGKVRDFC